MGSWSIIHALLRCGMARSWVAFTLADETRYLSMWGVYPEEDHWKSWIKIEEVGALAESPCRLPSVFAMKLYQLGETRMGGIEFTVVYADGTDEFFLTGNAVDFIYYPPGKSARVVVRVHHGGRGQPTFGPDYFWCLLS